LFFLLPIQESPQLGSDNEGGGPAAFKPGVQEVEFKVRVGFTHLTSMNDGHMSRNKRREKEWQTQNCKIVCKQGQWIGPLCRESKGKSFLDKCLVHFAKRVFDDFFAYFRRARLLMYY
jgi:hypothetical protein